VRLAREANALRALADEAREAAAAALGRADSERGQRERLEAEMRGERHAREELATRLSQFEAELNARDEALEQARAEHEAALAEREAEVRAEGDERVAAVEAEAAELRRSLKNARAEIELLRRERDRATATAQRAEVPTGRVAAEPSTHPEQDAAAPALPLPEGEEIGPVRPAAASNGHGPGDDDEDDYVPPPTTVAGGRVEPEVVDDGADDGAEHDDGDSDDGEADTESWSDDEESEGVRVLGRRRPRAKKSEAPPVEPLPGTAAIGARHIVPGDMGPSRLGPWIARGAAILALAFVIVAVLLVVLGMR
jgi:hypothetical protein